MKIDPVDQALHHKACLGGALSAEEQERLDNWYAQMDAEDFAVLQRSQRRHDALMDQLQVQTSQLVVEIAAEAKKMQLLETETENVRKETALLRSQLAEKNMARAG